MPSQSASAIRPHEASVLILHLDSPWGVQQRLWSFPRRVCTPRSYPLSPPCLLICPLQVSEQVDSLRVLGTDPVDYLVTPRVLASMIAGPILNVLCFCMGKCRKHAAMAPSLLCAQMPLWPFVGAREWAFHASMRVGIPWLASMQYPSPVKLHTGVCPQARLTLRFLCQQLHVWRCPITVTIYCHCDRLPPKGQFTWHVAPIAMSQPLTSTCRRLPPTQSTPDTWTPPSPRYHISPPCLYITPSPSTQASSRRLPA